MDVHRHAPFRSFRVAVVRIQLSAHSLDVKCGQYCGQGRLDGERDDPPGWDEYRALSFVFDRQAYLDTLSCARATVAALPHHLPEHHSRGWPWPWP